MLDRQKLLKQLNLLDQNFFCQADGQIVLAQKAWNLIKNDSFLAETLQSKKWSVLVPFWQGVLGQTFDIESQPHPYEILAVDGSQIYYDRHQGPACYLINVGSVFFSYGLKQSRIQFESTPRVIMLGSDDTIGMTAEVVNLMREQDEFAHAADCAQKITKGSQAPFLTLFDGTLIFFQADGQIDQRQQHFAKLMESFQKLYDQKILYAGYVSFPRSKELVNILKLTIAGFDEKKEEFLSLQALNDMDIAKLFLQPGQRSIIFESKAVVSYLYPKHLKPYFCYVHVGSEIARLEFSAWIAQDARLVDQVCGIVFDQVCKGQGYPVCLFEAHEQAVVKSLDRDFFYHMIQKKVQQQASTYQISKKSLKKVIVPV